MSRTAGVAVAAPIACRDMWSTACTHPPPLTPPAGGGQRRQRHRKDQ
jgi:hypothetical protein